MINMIALTYVFGEDRYYAEYGILYEYPWVKIKA